jgi:hypothetical protein
MKITEPILKGGFQAIRELNEKPLLIDGDVVDGDAIGREVTVDPITHPFVDLKGVVTDYNHLYVFVRLEGRHYANPVLPAQIHWAVAI